MWCAQVPIPPESAHGDQLGERMANRMQDGACKTIPAVHSHFAQGLHMTKPNKAWHCSEQKRRYFQQISKHAPSCRFSRRGISFLIRNHRVVSCRCSCSPKHPKPKLRIVVCNFIRILVRVWASTLGHRPVVPLDPLAAAYWFRTFSLFWHLMP